MALKYPPTGFHFIVRFDEGFANEFGGSEDIGFKEVSGLSTEVGTEEFREGGENRFAHRLPTPISYPKLVLKRGLLLGSAMRNWYTQSTENFSFKPYNMIITLLNQEGDPLDSWTIFNAYPVKWDVSSFNAMSNEIVVESVELNYKYFRRTEGVEIAPPTARSGDFKNFPGNN